MRREHIFAAVTAVVLSLAAAGCGDNPVGRICSIGADPDNDNQAILATPALDCPSRICLHQPVQGQLPPGVTATDQCTAFCDTDSDCDKVPESPCVNGFACAIPVVTGGLCCRKMCICKDYLVIPDGGIPEPKACDPGNADNQCCNLPGRENSDRCKS